MDSPMLSDNTLPEPASVSSPPRVAVVTGGANGIGWATVQSLAKDRAISVLFDRYQVALTQAHEALNRQGVEHLAIPVDIASEAAVDAAFGRVMARTSRPRERSST
jgi:3-oxoacyl-[acyl-carrier protein] reductase